MSGSTLNSAITVTGSPAIAVPCGFDSFGRPVGLQLVGKPRGEAALLQGDRVRARNRGDDAPLGRDGALCHHDESLFLEGQHVNLDHDYAVHIEWTGNRGSGTENYRGYSRDHTISAEGNPDILASSDKTFHGTPERWNPEELLLAALSDML